MPSEWIWVERMPRRWFQRGSFSEMTIGGVEQPVVFEMASDFNLQNDSRARECVKAIESEFHFNFVRRCGRDHTHLRKES